MPKKKKKEKKPMRLPPSFAQCKVVYIDESEIPGFGVSNSLAFKVS